jgi:beta-lactam-binding protein with PASTA domain
VPDLTNLTVADATKALADLQLLIEQLPVEFNDTVPAGQVIRQDPAPGSNLERDGTVKVVVSKGHAPITMPSALGVPLRKDEIVARLRELGFGDITISGDPTTKYLGLKVNGQPAYAGMQFPWGTAVEVLFAPTPATTTTAPPST